MRRVARMLACAALAASCGSPAPKPPASAPAVAPPVDAEAQIAGVLDAWHAAAARADENAYFALLAEDSVFLGTDAKERWAKAAFRAYAHPHFAKGKAWSFHATRRSTVVRESIAWFDEDLATENLGPARGTGVLRATPGGWRIVHYNLTITVPNERFKAVRELLLQP